MKYRGQNTAINVIALFVGFMDMIEIEALIRRMSLTETHLPRGTNTLFFNTQRCCSNTMKCSHIVYY